MAGPISTLPRRLGWTLLAFSFAAVVMASIIFYRQPQFNFYENGEAMKRLLLLPSSLALAVFFFLSACASRPAVIAATPVVAPALPIKPYMAQVVGVQWLNPLQRRDYSTEWQLLWTLGRQSPIKMMPKLDKIRYVLARYNQLA